MINKVAKVGHRVFRRSKKLYRSLEKKAILSAPNSFLVSAPGRAIAKYRYTENTGNCNDNFRRFVILAHGRSGSTLLSRTLNEHSRVVCHGEVFHPGRENETLWHTSPRFRWIRAIRNTHPQCFLDLKVFCPYPDEIQRVGFKIFPSQYIDPRFRETTRRLIDQPGISLIRLKRPNKLHVHVSYLQARKTGEWESGKLGENSRSKYELFIDPEKCLQAFKSYEMDDLFFDKLCVGKDHISISYSDLDEQFDVTMKRVQRYLGVTYEVLAPTLKKQRKGCIEDCIVNYKELKKYFCNTRYSSYFEAD